MVILFLSVNACRKTEFTSPEQELIQQAKANFEAEKSLDDPKQIGFASSNKKSKKEANWNKAYTNQFAKQKVVIVPVLHYMSISLSTNGASHKLFYESYLYSYQNIQGDWNHELIYKIPNAEYLLNKNPNKRFSGRILIEDWEGNFVKGYLIEKNNLTKSLTLLENSNYKSTAVSGCETIKFTKCRDYYVQGQYQGTDCYEYTYMSCTYDAPPEETLAPDDYGQGSGGGGGSGTSGSDGLEPNPGSNVGKKPIAEYVDKCQGVIAAWDNFPSNEVVGYITEDGEVIITDVLGYFGEGESLKAYSYQGEYFYHYPKSLGPPSNVKYFPSGPNYYIMVVARFHTHAPCRTEGGSGVNQLVSDNDKESAKSTPGLRQWVIGCNAIAEFQEFGPFFNKSSGDLNEICDKIK